MVAQMAKSGSGKFVFGSRDASVASQAKGAAAVAAGPKTSVPSKGKSAPSQPVKAKQKQTAFGGTRKLGNH
jgi:cell division septation protein DedD